MNSFLAEATKPSHVAGQKVDKLKNSIQVLAIDVKILTFLKVIVINIIELTLRDGKRQHLSLY